MCGFDVWRDGEGGRQEKAGRGRRIALVDVMAMVYIHSISVKGHQATPRLDTMHPTDRTI